MKTLKEVFEALVNKMQQFDLYTMNPRDEVALALDELKDKIDEVSEYEEPIAVGRIEYDFPQSVFTIANEDNTEIVCDVYEDDFNKLCSMGMIRFLLEEGDEERFSVKGNCSDYLLKSNEFISITKKREIDLTTVPIIKEPIPQTVSEEPRPLPKCVKINGKVFLYGSERYEVVINDNDLGMIELFDMTTEMETGDSYSMFVSDISFFEVASDEERQAVADFFIKSQLELFPN